MFVLSFFVLLVSILIYSEGSLVLFAKSNYNGFDIKCISNNLTRAIAWDTPIQEEFYKTESNLGHKQDVIDLGDPWIFMNSLKLIDVGPVTDERWEDFSTFFTKGEQILNFGLLADINVRGYFQIPISIKLKKEGHIYICNEQYKGSYYNYSPVYMKCIWILLGGWNGTKSAIRNCNYNEIPNNNVGPSSSSCKKLLAVSEHNPLTDTQWKHFSITVGNSYIRVIDLHDSDFVLEYNDENVENIIYSKIFVNSRLYSNGYWKLHDYDTRLLIIRNEEILFYKFLNANICITMYIYVHKHCKLAFLTYNRDIIKEVTETANWEYVTLDYNFRNYDYSIYVILTGGDQCSAAVSKINNCQASQNHSSIIRNIPSRLINSVKCIYLDNTSENIGITITDNKWTNTFCNSTDHYGTSCSPCANEDTGNCKNVMICEKINQIDECYCGAGYTGQYCNTQCNQYKYGYNCEKACGQCQYNCDNVNGKCDNYGCKSNYIGEYCDKVELPIIQEAPKLIDEQCYTKCAFSFDPQKYIGENKPIKYQVEYKVERARKWMTAFEISDVYVNTFSIDNLDISRKYVCRVVLYTIDGKAYDKENIPEYNFETACKEPSDDELEIIVTANTAIISLKPHNKITSCNKNKYSIYLNKMYKLEETILNLEPYTDYSITILNTETNFQLMKTFQTLEDAPSEVQNLKVEQLDNSSVLLNWLEPNQKRGVIKKYIINLKHISYIACPNTQSKIDVNEIESTETKVSLKLLPYSKYLANIAAFTILKGPDVAIEFDTDALPDDINPALITITLNNTSKSNQIKVITKAVCESITKPVFITATINCLSDWCKNKNKTKEIRTPFNDTFFNDLHSYTDYQFIAYLNFSENALQLMDIPFRTKEDAPNAVRNFEVFSKSETTIFLKWDAPYPPTGEIEAYEINYYYYNFFGTKVPETKQISDRKCKIWPTMSCYKIENLHKNNEYNIEIRAKNKHVQQLSRKMFTSTRTIVEYPEKPINLKAEWDKYYNLTLEWQHPNKINGPLKNFIIFINTDRYETNKLSPNLTYTVTIPFEKVGMVDALQVRVFTTNTKYQSRLFETINVQIPPTTPSFAGIPIVIEQSNKTIKLLMPNIKNAESNCVVLFLVSCENNQEINQNLLNASIIDNNFCIYKVIKVSDIAEEIIIGDNSLSKFNEFSYNNVELNSGTKFIFQIIVLNEKHGYYRYNKYIIDTKTTQGEVVQSNRNNPALYALLLLLLLPVIYFVIRNKKKMPDLGIYIRRDPPQESLPLTKNINVVPEKPLVKPQVPKKEYSKSVKISDFQEYVKESIFNDDLSKQFTLFPRGELKPCDYGKLPQNKQKNRYMNLIAYNHTRVHLTKIDKDNFSDYINANYIEGISGPKAYIATQGPKPTTLYDFWRMMWDENVKHIVMLANVFENGKKKTEQYWPNYNEQLNFKNLSIRLLSCEVFADFEYRTLILTNETEEKKVEQLHFTTWPDHGVPLYPQSLVPFIRKILTISQGTSPIVIHCSAGVGRTGTIILIDLCLRMAALYGCVDAFHHLHQLREQRANLVDNLDQYKLAHLVILECLLAPDTSIPCQENFEERISNISKTEIDQQMEYIINSAWQEYAIVGKNTNQIANYPHKNRFQEIIPESYGVVYLPPNPASDESSSYINAVFVDGFQTPKRYFATQQPLPSTLCDFWRLVTEQEVSIIVSLQEINIDDNTCCKFYPDDKNNELTIMPKLQLSHSGTENLETFSIINLIMKYKEEIRKVSIVQLNNWKYGKMCPTNDAAILAVWQQMNQLSWNNNPIIITCHDGATACGIYIATCFILEKIKLEQICDVCQAVRVIRRSRKQFILSEEQFIYLYKLANLYLKEFEMYSNFNK